MEVERKRRSSGVRITWERSVRVGVGRRGQWRREKMRKEGMGDAREMAACTASYILRVKRVPPRFVKRL